MAEQSGIEWCDSTFNPWMGCTKVSPACDHCYAEALVESRFKLAKWGPGQPRQRTSEAYWRQPLRWHRYGFFECRCGWRGGCNDMPDRYGDSGTQEFPSCPQCGAINYDGPNARRRVFCASLADVFDNEVDPLWRRDLFALIRRTPNLDWLLLTKRIGNADCMIAEAVESLPCDEHCGGGQWNQSPIAQWPWPNVWLGATVVNQAEADRDVPKLLATPAAVRFVSIEPMLGPVKLRPEWFPHWCSNPDCEEYGAAGVDWVIAGGESGPHARPANPDWFRSLRDQCEVAGAAFLLKQWGEWAPPENRAGPPTRTEAHATLIGGEWRFGRQTVAEWLPPEEEPDVYRVGKRAAGRTLDGRTHDGFPEVRR